MVLHGTNTGTNTVTLIGSTSADQLDTTQQLKQTNNDCQDANTNCSNDGSNLISIDDSGATTSLEQPASTTTT